MGPGVEDLKRRVAALDAELREISCCALCGRPFAGVVPQGQTAEEAGLCTGAHSLHVGRVRDEWWRRYEHGQTQLRWLEEGRWVKEAKRVRRYLTWAYNAYLVATVHAASPERVERESRRAWRWLREAEAELAKAEGKERAGA